MQRTKSVEVVTAASTRRNDSSLPVISEIIPDASPVTSQPLASHQKTADASNASSDAAVPDPATATATIRRSAGGKEQVPALADTHQGKRTEKSEKTQKHAPALIVKTALNDLQAAGKDTANAARSLAIALRDKQKPINVTLDQALGILFFLYLGFQLLLIRLISPSPAYLFVFMVVGTGIGLAFSFLYYQNLKQKAEICQVMSANLGLKGLHHLVGHLPSWLSYTETEKMEWLNSFLEEMWPFVDKAVCDKIKLAGETKTWEYLPGGESLGVPNGWPAAIAAMRQEVTETVFDGALKTQKVPIKRVGFKQLTFGDAPFRVEHIYVNPDASHGMELMVGVRWCGEANITLAIQLVGEATEVCPQVTDISFSGLLRIRLAPMVDKIPGFGALMVTFMKTPRIKYRLNFGSALGGSYIASVVKPFINSTVNNVLVNMLVWPQRLVVPVLPNPDPETQMAINRMQFIHRGVLKVEVLQADGLKAADYGGRSDPFVELTTDGKYTATSKCIKKTLTPVWNESFWLLVQEPSSQEMKVTVSDKDLLSASDVLGKTLVKLKPAVVLEDVPPPGNSLTSWYHLGEGQWSDPQGCGKGCGRIQLRMTFHSFANIQPKEAAAAVMGIVTVQIFKAHQMATSSKPLSLFCVVKCQEEVFETPATVSKGSEEFFFRVRNGTEFYNVKDTELVKISVVEKTAMGNDVAGFLERNVADISESNDVNPLTGLREAGLMVQDAKLEDSTYGMIHFVLRFVPYI